jgi:drug/metabolite transporter (DMT)-like permease
MILSPILFRERLTLFQIGCFLASTVGLVLITVGGAQGGETHVLGILFALGAAVFYATVILLNKYITGVEGLQRTFWQFLSTVVILLPYVFLGGGVGLSSLDWIGWGCLLTVGLVHTGVAYCLYFSSLRNLPGQTAAILSYVDPLVAVMVSVTLLKEGISVLQAVGGVLVLGFTLLNEIGPKKLRGDT